MKRLQYNAPVVLTFALISLISLGLGYLTQSFGKFNTTYLLFSTYRSSLLNPLTYLRAFTHVLGHANWSHFAGNMTLILLIGPMLEEKYGGASILEMICITAVITAIINAVFFPHTMLLGASGIVYMMIILASQANLQEGKIPLTLVLACIVYIGGEMVKEVATQDNVAHFAHVIGGVCGGAFGYLLVHNTKAEN